MESLTVLLRFNLSKREPKGAAYYQGATEECLYLVSSPETRR